MAFTRCHWSAFWSTAQSCRPQEGVTSSRSPGCTLAPGARPRHTTTPRPGSSKAPGRPPGRPGVLR
eukprot:4891659-Alexandrium_andersonii.AAC.1